MAKGFKDSNGKFRPTGNSKSGVSSNQIQSWENKKLSGGFTVAEMWNMYDFQWLDDLLAEAGVNSPFWDKVTSDDEKVRLKNLKPDWVDVPDVDKPKIAKVLINDDKRQYEEEIEKKEWDN